MSIWKKIAIAYLALIPIFSVGALLVAVAMYGLSSPDVDVFLKRALLAVRSEALVFLFVLAWAALLYPE